MKQKLNEPSILLSYRRNQLLLTFLLLRQSHTCAENLFLFSLAQVGQTNINHMLTPKGRVYSEMTVSQVEPNKFLCLTGSGSELHDERYIPLALIPRNALSTLKLINSGLNWRWLETQRDVMNFDVTINNVTDSTSVLGVAGPNSRALLKKLTKTDLSNDAFDFLQCANLTIAGVDCFAVRISYSGEITDIRSTMHTFQPACKSF